MAKRRRLLALLTGAVGIGLFVLTSASGCAKNTVPATDFKELAMIEIRDYQGENLSSIAEFRENSIKGPQFVDEGKYRLTVTGLVNTPLTLTYGEVIEKYEHLKKVVRLDCVEGWSVTILWEGIRVKDLLAGAGVQPAAKLAIFHAYDGYTTALPVAYLLEKDIILAHKMNGITIPPERGFPFQLIAESKWGYKWAKWVTQIELSADENYRGYWETRGYSGSGDRDKEFFEPRY